MMLVKNAVKLIAAMGICLAVGVLGGWGTASSVKTWYGILRQPVFTPPDWIFAPVWTALYILMGISLFLMIKDPPGQDTRRALQYFGIQLAANAMWPFLFFGLRSPLYGLLDIVLLWGFIFCTIKYSFKVSKPAAYLLIPYIAWVSFALILNCSIYLLNR
ncbi:MAG: tryptophan-rich sensory protein [Candidatus Omnitrophica bacterium]|nr:tryptophan-rich sensory protein [Candidatus Omnitrophota bacterium]